MSVPAATFDEGARRRGQTNLSPTKTAPELPEQFHQWTDLSVPVHGPNEQSLKVERVFNGAGPPQPVRST